MSVPIAPIRPDFLWNKPQFTNFVVSANGKTTCHSGLVAAAADALLVEGALVEIDVAAVVDV